MGVPARFIMDVLLIGSVTPASTQEFEAYIFLPASLQVVRYCATGGLNAQALASSDERPLEPTLQTWFGHNPKHNSSLRAKRTSQRLTRACGGPVGACNALNDVDWWSRFLKEKAVGARTYSFELTGCTRNLVHS